MILDNVVWGFIGCGSVTEKKSGPALASTPGSRVAAVMRRNAALAEDYARRHAVPRWYTDADALIGDPDVNAVYVATPPSTHMQYALQAIAAGNGYVNVHTTQNGGGEIRGQLVRRGQGQNQQEQRQQ